MDAFRQLGSSLVWHKPHHSPWPHTQPQSHIYVTGDNDFYTLILTRIEFLPWAMCRIQFCHVLWEQEYFPPWILHMSQLSVSQIHVLAHVHKNWSGHITFLVHTQAVNGWTVQISRQWSPDFWFNFPGLIRTFLLLKHRSSAKLPWPRSLFRWLWQGEMESWQHNTCAYAEWMLLTVWRWGKETLAGKDPRKLKINSASLLPSSFPHIK